MADYYQRYTTLEGVWSDWQTVDYWSLPLGVLQALEPAGVVSVVVNYRDMRFEYKFGPV